ncbi:MAG: hypothetical protein IPP71_10155 [Bacteroidetes bacterium]|nr:hypothetical protein [Bacteroidota bacterium]
MKNGSLDSDKLDKLIDFFKTVVFTSALGTVALLVTDLFKEREQDIKELEYFAKYVEEVKDVNGQSRLQLSKYFSIVAPNGDMKKSWTNYYIEVKKEYNEYLLAQKALERDTSSNPSLEESYTRQINQEKVELFEKPISRVSSVTEWYVVAGGDVTLEAAKYELEKAIKVNANSNIIKKGSSYRTVLMGYTTRAEAEKQLEIVKQKINSTAYIVNKSTWCKTIEMGDECLICE